MAKFFGEEAPFRMTTLASENFIQKRLIQVFGSKPQFTLERAGKMKEQMIKDLANNKKEEYMSPVGLALLYDKSGGELTEDMADIVTKSQKNSAQQEALINEIRVIWDEWDIREGDHGDNALAYDSFYHAFMIPYFGCFRCEDTRIGLDAIDMDDDGLVDWK